MATTPGTITNFTTKSNGVLDIGGNPYFVETAAKSYSLTEPDAQTLQFEIQPGDHAYFDGSNVDRAEVDGAANGYIPTNTPVNISYQFMVQANGANGSFTNTANWFVTAEMHNADKISGVSTSPPFAVQLAGDHLQIVARYCAPGGNPSNSSSDLKMLTLWTDPNPIQTGQYANIQIQANVSNTSAGYLEVSVNGTQVVNYHGPLGYGTPTYWEEGLYRNAGPTQTVTADFRNLSITTGSAAVSGGSGGTTTTGTGTGSTSTTGSSGGSTSSGSTTGTGSGSTSSGSGTTPPKGTGSGTVGTGASGGATPPKVTGSGTGVGTGASGGATPPKGTGSGTVGTGASGGATPPKGTGSGTVGTGASGGATPPKVTGSGTGVGTGASGGATPPKVTGSGTGVGTGASGGATPPKVTGSGTGVGTGASGGVTPPKIPVLSVADHSLSVSPGKGVALGIGVTVPNKGDAVTVHVAGLAKYETITDKLDHKTFSGSSISLTAAEVNSGLTLTSHYRGHGDPSTTLSVTATDSTGKPVTTAAQTITVKDPPATVASSGTSSGSTTSKPGTPVTGSSSGHHHHHHHFAHWFGHHSGFAPIATTLSDAGASKSAATSKVGTATDSAASAGAKSYALLNQMMAGDSGHDAHFAQVATASTASLQHSVTSLTKPLH
jgi:Polysaccharide lyase